MSRLINFQFRRKAKIVTDKLILVVDDGEVDDKIIVVPSDNRDEGDRMISIDDNPTLKRQLEHHFSHYKDLKKPGSTEIVGWGDAEEAKKIIAECIERYNNRTE